MSKKFSAAKFPYYPKPSGYVDAYAPNKALEGLEKVGSGLEEAEFAIFDAAGAMYTTTPNGYVLKILEDNSTEQWAYTAGRPLGGKFDAMGDLIVCVVAVGLCKVDHQTRQVTVLANMCDGRPIITPNAIDIASDGKIYFSDSTDIAPDVHSDNSIHMIETSVTNFLAGSRSGRLLVHDPKTGETSSLVNDIFFCCGCCLSHDESFVLAGSCFDVKVLKHHLTGPKAGTTEDFLKDLPGCVDNISRSADGGFYIAIPSPYTSQLKLLSKQPFLRKVASKEPKSIKSGLELYDMVVKVSSYAKSITEFQVAAKLPKALKPGPELYGMVVKVSSDGQNVSTLQDPKGKTAGVVHSTVEHGGYLYVCTFENDHILRLKL